MNVKKWTIHILIECKECDWDTGDHINGRQKAHEHHRRTGHAMRGEVGIHYEWPHRNGER